MQNVYCRFDRFHDLSIISSEIAKDVCLFLKNSHDRLDSVARFKLLGEGMVSQLLPRLFLVVFESDVEEELERVCLFHF